MYKNTVADEILGLVPQSLAKGKKPLCIATGWFNPTHSIRLPIRKLEIYEKNM